MRLLLASSSPRRAELLRAAGFAFDVAAANIDESARTGESPAAYVERLAIEKARAVAALTGPRDGATVDAPFILGADTAVVVDGEVLGKPRDDEDGGDMLRRLSGRWHEVLTGVCLMHLGEHLSQVETTRVQFASLSRADIEWYIASAEGRDKAGGYAIQGLASRFVPRLDGSYTNVVGLPVLVVKDLLKQFETRYSLG